jgi:peptidoglycan/LPS O-acetylase OafA/YrhL
MSISNNIPPESSHSSVPLILENTSRPHLVKLDALRGFAILAVFLIHTLGPVFLRDQLNWTGFWRDFSSANNPIFFVFYPFTFGWIGVSIFFVLSGFVIHLSYLNAKQFTIPSFYWKRFWRIYPPYLLTVVLCILFNWKYYGVQPEFWQTITHLLMVYNFNEKHLNGINGSFWSLAIEFQLYLIYPILLFLRQKLGFRKAMIVTFSISLFLRFLILSSTAFYNRPFSSIEGNFPLLLWFDWALGAYIADGYFKKEQVFYLSKLTIFLLISSFVFSTLYLPASTISFTLSSLITAILLEQYIQSKRELSTIEKAFVPLGLCSYSFYLIHFPMIYPLTRLFISLGVSDNILIQMLFVMPVIFCLIFAISWILYITVEKGSSALGKWTWKVLNF